MRKIIRASRFLKWATFIFCIALPLIEAGFWITKGYPFLKSIWSFGALPMFNGRPVTWAGLNDLQRFLGFIINMIPTAFSMASLIFLMQLFISFERLDIFAKRNVNILRKAGWALLLGQIFYPVYMALYSLALTFCNPVGQRNISIAFGGDQLKVTLIAIGILLVSWIFAEAVKLYQEQEGTV